MDVEEPPTEAKAPEAIADEVDTHLQISECLILL